MSNYFVEHGHLGNKTYVFVGFTRVFSKARNKCGKVGADLVRIESMEELQYINSQMEGSVSQTMVHLLVKKKSMNPSLPFPSLITNLIFKTFSIHADTSITKKFGPFYFGH